ncbi:N-acetylmuramoyl-L-alanine amidase [Clostridium perfringens]|nr:N-acetylmuramoyl-L-alanine amidase [Clostridium perfringens]
MKIAIRGGHNFLAKGACGLIDETIEDRKVYKAVIKNLIENNFEVLDVTPGDCDVNTDLKLGVDKANNFNADLFISIHFDKCYDKFDGPLGTGTWICEKGGKAEIYAQNIVDTISEGTSLKNRGVKTNAKLYELNKTIMPAVIVEVCFCESKVDVDIYREKGSDLIGYLIAKGICKSINKEISSDLPQVNLENNTNSQNNNLFKTNATAKVALDPRDNPSNNYKDLGEIYANERIKILAEVCDLKFFLPATYWQDALNKESSPIWVNSKQTVLNVDTNATVINVLTELDARYTPSPDSNRMGYVKNQERLFVHKIENNYALATYLASEGYKTAWFTAEYIKLD